MQKLQFDIKDGLNIIGLISLGTGLYLFAGLGISLSVIGVILLAIGQFGGQ